MNKSVTVTLLVILSVFSSCDIKKTDSTTGLELSSIELTSSSYRAATDFVYEEDDVYVAVDFMDDDQSADNLYMTVTSSGGTLILSKEIGSFAIYDGVTWKTNFSTTGMAPDTYTIETYATDISEKASNTLTKDFTIQDDIRDDVLDTDLAVAFIGAGFEIAAGAEPFRFHFTVQNNSPVIIDLVQIEFEAWDGVTSRGTTFGIVENLAVLENRIAVAKADIPAALNVTSVTFDPDYLIEFY